MDRKFDKEILNSLENLNYANNTNFETATHGFKSLEAKITEVAITSSHQNITRHNEITRQINQQTQKINGINDNIKNMSFELGYKLDEVNRGLFKIDSTLQITNQSLNFIGNELATISRSINQPYEVKALELAKQARDNLIAYDDKKKMLQITARAMEECNTSIPVIAHHIIALAVQEEDNLDQINSLLVNYANLIKLKLKEGVSIDTTISEINAMTYPIIHAVAEKYGAAVLDPVKTIYSAIAILNKAKLSFFEKGLWEDQIAIMANSESILRELHYSSSYDVLVKNNHKGEEELAKTLTQFIARLDESGSPITTELQKATTSICQRSGIYKLLFHKYFNSNHENISRTIELWLENEFSDNSDSLEWPIKTAILDFHEKSKPSFQTLFKNYGEKLNTSLNDEVVIFKNEVNLVKNQFIKEANELTQNLNANSQNKFKEIEGFQKEREKNDAKLGVWWRTNYDIDDFDDRVSIIIGAISGLTAFFSFGIEGFWSFIGGAILGLIAFRVGMLIAKVIRFILFAIFDPEYSSEIEDNCKSSIKSQESSIISPLINFEEKYEEKRRYLNNNRIKVESELFGDFKPYYEGHSYLRLLNFTLPTFDSLFKNLDPRILKILQNNKM